MLAVRVILELRLTTCASAFYHENGGLFVFVQNKHQIQYMHAGELLTYIF